MRKVFQLHRGHGNVIYDVFPNFCGMISHLFLNFQYFLTGTLLISCIILNLQSFININKLKILF